MILLVLLKYVIKYQFIKVYIYIIILKQSIICNSKVEEICLHVYILKNIYFYVILRYAFKMGIYFICRCYFILFHFVLRKWRSVYRQKGKFLNGRLLGDWEYCFLMAEFYCIFLTIHKYVLQILQLVITCHNYCIFSYIYYILKILKYRADQQITKHWIWDIWFFFFF